MKDKSIAIAVLARAPIPGQTKTRLLPSLDAKGAADLQKEFILRTLKTALAAKLGPVSLWCAPDCAHPFFEQCRENFGVTLHPQCAGDLGARMFYAFANLCQEGPLLLIGTDCPALTPAHLHMAAQNLREGDDAVFFPAEDGGYVLVGLQRAESMLFSDMPWSRPELMEVTRQRLMQLCWRWREPALLWDVDNCADFERLRSSGQMNEWFAGND